MYVITYGGCVSTAWESVVKADYGEKNPLPHHRGSVVKADCGEKNPLPHHRGSAEKADWDKKSLAASQRVCSES